MKRNITIIVSLTVMLVALVLLSACGSRQMVDNIYGDPDAFLEDMAEGIAERIEKNDAIDLDNASAEENAEYDAEFVQCELNKIEKYSESTFEDETFDKLAHYYIDACEMQEFAAENYKNSNIFSPLWDNGRAIRAAIITELYQRYGLPISAEMAEEYNTTYAVEYVLDLPEEDVSETTQTPENSEWVNKEIYNADGIVITIKELNLDYGYELVFEIENNWDTDSGICIYGSDAYIGNYQYSLANEIGDIAHGKTGTVSIELFSDDITEPVSDDDDIEFNLAVADSTDTYYHELSLTIPVLAFN